MEGLCSVYFVQRLGRMKGHAGYACNSFGILNVVKWEKGDISEGRTFEMRLTRFLDI